MRIGKRALALALVGVLTVGVAGCGDDDDGGADADTATAAAGAGVKIGYISLGETVPFVGLVTQGIRDATEAAGAELVFCDSQLDAQKALDCARQLKTQQVDGILNFQVDESAAPRVCQAGPDVPVIAIDILQKPCQDVFYGADNANAGNFAGEVLGQYAKDEWNCDVDALLVLEQGSAGQVVADRLGGMTEGVKASCPDVKSETVAYEGTTDSAIQPIRDTLGRVKGDHILLVAVNDDGVIGAIKGAQQVGRANDIYVAGQGADPTSFPYLCGENDFKNWIADTAYFPERYGADTVPILLDLIAGGTSEPTVFVKHEAVTQDNIREVYPEACTS